MFVDPQYKRMYHCLFLGEVTFLLDWSWKACEDVACCYEKFYLLPVKWLLGFLEPTLSVLGS